MYKQQTTRENSGAFTTRLGPGATAIPCSKLNQISTGPTMADGQQPLQAQVQLERQLQLQLQLHLQLQLQR